MPGMSFLKTVYAQNVCYCAYVLRISEWYEKLRLPGIYNVLGSLQVANQLMTKEVFLKCNYGLAMLLFTKIKCHSNVPTTETLIQQPIGLWLAQYMNDTCLLDVE